MRTALILIPLLVGSICTNASLKIQERIGFEPNSTSIDNQSKHVIDSLISYFDEYDVEKIDIVGYCMSEDDNEFNLVLSRKRSLAVFDYLTQFYPDLDVYEIRYYGVPFSPLIFGRDKGSSVQITIYLLERNVDVKASNIELALFPEEADWIGMANHDINAPSQPSGIEQPTFTYIPKTYSAQNSFNIDAIHFYGNSALYKDESDPALEELVAFMKYYPDVKIIIEGHVNGKMGRGYLRKSGNANPEKRVYKNARELSFARAETIKEYLVFKGIDSTRIACVGKGGSEMRYPHPKNNMQHEANRRIEIIIVDD